MDIKLNLGCGKNYKPDYINVDNCSEYGNHKVDYEIDINKKLPFYDNQFNLILCSHIIEHIKDREKLFKEIYRVLKSGGRLIIKVPHISIPIAFGLWQHKNYWTYNTIEHYADGKFRIDMRELRWKLPVHPISKFVNKIINKKPLWSERYLANYIGGFEEIYMELIKK